MTDSYAKVEIMGHHVAIGRVSEVSRFGAVFCQVEAIDEEGALGRPVLHGGAAIFRLTPLSREEAIELVKNPYMTVKVLPQRASDDSSYDPYEDYADMDEPDEGDDCDPNDNDPEDIQPLGVDAIRVKPITTLPNATDAFCEMYGLPNVRERIHVPICEHLIVGATEEEAQEILANLHGAQSEPSEFKRIGEEVHDEINPEAPTQPIRKTYEEARKACLVAMVGSSLLPDLNTVDGRREAAESPAPEWELDEVDAVIDAVNAAHSERFEGRDADDPVLRYELGERKGDR